MVARVAPPGYTLRAGDAVTSTGCNNGEDPTIQHSHINTLDRFLDPAEQRGGNAASGIHGPWNLQVAGQPVVGRSGGGLFSTDGMVIGVCNAAEPVDQEGLFAALGSIHAALDQQRLASLYKQPVAPPAMVPALENSPATLVAVDPFSAGRTAEPRVRIPSPEPPAVSSSATAGPAATATAHAAANDSAVLASNEQAILDEVRRRAGDGSEVVCIIRNHNDPQGKSEVITLDRASPAFINQLSSAAQPKQLPHETSLEVPKRPTPILEWDIQSGWKHQGSLP